MMPDFHVITPARYASTRLPGKPLLNIAGKPMILHVCEVARVSQAVSVTVATDDHRIQEVVCKAGGNAILTTGDHETGSDRIAEACTLLGLPNDAIIVNVQGDEPELSPVLIHQVVRLLITHQHAVMATLCTVVADVSELMDPSAVKVVIGHNDRAIWFSRTPLPPNRPSDTTGSGDASGQSVFRHVGIYACRVDYLLRFARRGPCPLERLERLEQLRVLWHGECIVCGVAIAPPPQGVDTPEDLLRVRKRLESSAER